MNLGLRDKVVLVTGASKGIGADIALFLAREGLKVAFCARPSRELTRLQKTIESANGVCLPIETDVFEPAQITDCVNQTVSAFGGMDILVNNVGGAIRPGSFDDLEDSEWIRSYELNVMSAVRFTKAALPHLRKSSLRRIINISSISAVQPGLFNPHYTVTKAAVVNLTKHLANILAKEKILVNVICPGPVHSDSWNQNIQRIADERGISLSQAVKLVEAQESAKVPLGSIGEGEKIAGLVAFLASSHSSWTTGSCFHVNGGKLAGAF